MKKKITYHQRLLYTLITGGVFAIILYNMAISNTIDLIIENGALKEQISKNQDAPEQIKKIKKDLKKIEQLVGNNDYVEIDVHQELLQLVTDNVQKKGLILKDFPQPYVTTDEGYVTKTALANVEGDFIDLLKLVYFLEMNYKVGKVVAVDFNTTKELRTRKRKLSSTIYIQNVKAENNEENN